MISKSNLYEAQSNFFKVFIYLSYSLLFISALGLSQTAPKYLDTMDYYIRIYICLFLMWRFNPLREKPEFTELDRKIAFSAGAFILTTTALNQYLVQFKETVKNIIAK
jgi:cytochrome c biogenesis protein CcdA